MGRRRLSRPRLEFEIAIEYSTVSRLSVKPGLGFLMVTLANLLVAQQPNLEVNPRILKAHVEFIES